MGPTYSGINQEEGRAEEVGWPEEAGREVSPTSGYREREMPCSAWELKEAGNTGLCSKVWHRVGEIEIYSHRNGVSQGSIGGANPDRQSSKSCL